MNKNSERLLLLLEQIATGLVGVAAHTSMHSTRPIWFKLYREMQADTYIKKYHLRQKVKGFENKNIIILRNNEYRLTAKGKILLKELRVKNCHPKKHKWDRIWRMVSYDIPQEEKGKRYALISQFKRWGFKLVHQSLWVYPWKCEEEIKALVHQNKVEKFVIFMTTKSLPMEERLKKYFRIQ